MKEKFNLMSQDPATKARSQNKCLDALHMTNSFCYVFNKHQKKLAALEASVPADKEEFALVLKKERMSLMNNFWLECQELYSNCDNYGFVHD